MRLLHGDMRTVLATLEPESVHACVTDPPYELGFMGKGWDKTGVAFDPAAWAEVYRVLKPGGYLLAFSATRTYHRMAVAIEDAGFEIRDQIMWLYGSGMPKGLNVSKAIDKAAGAEREVVGTWKPTGTARIKGDMGTKPSSATDGYQTQDIRSELPITIPATDAARAWDGWNSAIKPACEPVCVARKPFKGTIVANVLAHGTGAYHVDACRIHTDGEPNGDLGRVRSVESYQSKSDGWRRPWMEDDDAMAQSESRRNESAQKATTLGRWPANVCIDEAAAAALDAMSGESVSRATGYDFRASVTDNPTTITTNIKSGVHYEDRGGASRFFFIAQPDCWLCGNPKRGTMNATNHARGGECCEPANTAESSSLPSTSPADSVAGVAPDLQPLRLGDNSPEASTLVSSAASTSMSGQGTSASTAQRNAIQHHAEQLAPRVSDVGNLCERCGIAIAQSLASHSANHAPSPVGPGSIGERNARILNLSLALFAKSQGSTDTTLTTASLKLLFGYVRDAIAHSTLTGATETESGQTTRLKYSPKSSQAERNIGHAPGERNTHATVKPIDLMQWLVRLVTPPQGIVLDPFMGSGSTGVACSREGFQFIGIDLDEHNVETARKRIVGDAPLFAEVSS